jgi:hypothetical protein
MNDGTSCALEDGDDDDDAPLVRRNDPRLVHRGGGGAVAGGGGVGGGQSPVSGNTGSVNRKSSAQPSSTGIASRRKGD